MKRETPRQARVERKTLETEVVLHLNVDGAGAAKVATTIPFFDHMLAAWSKHGFMDLTVDAHGDTEVDLHHTVEDVGIGLEPESLDRLFSPFYTTKPGGMGIGLSICRSIVEAHEGRVWASRNNGPGMTFQFTIPAYRDSPKAPAPSRSAERA